MNTPSAELLSPVGDGADSFPLARWWHAVAFDHCRILLPNFTFTHRSDPLGRLNRLAVDDNSVHEHPVRTGPTFITRLAFAAIALRQLWIYFWRYSGYVARHDGVSRGRQLQDLWHCVWRHNHYARHYYWRKLYRVPSRAEWLNNLEHRQMMTLLRHLNRRLPIGRVADKYQFNRHCRLYNLPSPTVLACWDRRGQLRDDPPAPVAADVFVKPTGEYNSFGTAVIPYDPATGTHRLEQRDLFWPALLDALGARAVREQRGLVLQPRLRNAARSAAYGNNDLCNLRIVTAVPPDGAPEPLGAFIRLPSHFTTTGYDRHVLFANIDLATGRMGVGRFREITKGEFVNHPDTGVPIADRVVPGWDELLALALRAHGTMRWLPFVGWDLIDTESGPMLLEANAYWGVDAMQPAGVTPLGRTRFPEIYLAWFDRFYGVAPAPVPIP